jgi:hypothetical protein
VIVWSCEEERGPLLYVQARVSTSNTEAPRAIIPRPKTADQLLPSHARRPGRQPIEQCHDHDPGTIIGARCPQGTEIAKHRQGLAGSDIE